MENFKGSKGKWVVDEKENWFDVQTENNDRIVSVDKSDVKFAKHDALLISKAPEMLDLLDRFSTVRYKGASKKELDSLFIEAEQLIKSATEL